MESRTGARCHRPPRGLLSAATAVAASAANGAQAGGRDTDCVIGGRSYRIAFPGGHDGTTPIGAIVFSHGYRGTANGVMGNKALTALADDLGVALIATPAGGPDSNIPGAPAHHAPAGLDQLAACARPVAHPPSRCAVRGGPPRGRRSQHGGFVAIAPPRLKNRHGAGDA